MPTTRQRRPNMVALGAGRYLVRTQAGYRRALRDVVGENRTLDPEKREAINAAGCKYYKDLLLDHRRSYGSYPAIVTFHIYYSGGCDAIDHIWRTIEEFWEARRAERALVDAAVPDPKSTQARVRVCCGHVMVGNDHDENFQRDLRPLLGHLVTISIVPGSERLNENGEPWKGFEKEYPLKKDQDGP